MNFSFFPRKIRKKGTFSDTVAPLSISAPIKMIGRGMLCLDNIPGNGYKIYKLSNLDN